MSLCVRVWVVMGCDPILCLTMCNLLATYLHLCMSASVCAYVCLCVNVCVRAAPQSHLSTAKELLHKLAVAVHSCDLLDTVAQVGDWRPCPCSSTCLSRLRFFLR